ncbi:hypothetical protein RKD20_008916 [Streptomyces sp. SLBN-8D4]
MRGGGWPGPQPGSPHPRRKGCAAQEDAYNSVLGLIQQTAGRARRAESPARAPWRYRWIVLGIATFTQAAAGFFVALLGAGLFIGCYRRPPALPVPQDKQPSASPAAQLRGRLRMLREPSAVKIMLSGTSLISVQCGVGILTVLHLHKVSSIGAGRAALVLVASQGTGVAGRICLAAWSDRSSSGRHAIVLVCMVAVIAGLDVLMTPAGGHRPLLPASSSGSASPDSAGTARGSPTSPKRPHRAGPASPWGWPCPSTRSP